MTFITFHWQLILILRLLKLFIINIIIIYLFILLFIYLFTYYLFIFHDFQTLTEHLEYISLTLILDLR